MVDEAKEMNADAVIGVKYGSSQVMSEMCIRDSYDSLMEKLEVDISVVEREKERITELLEDYVREIHSNLCLLYTSRCV